MLGAVVSAPRRSVVAVTVCGGGTVGVTQVDEDGPGPVSAAGRPEGASKGFCLLAAEAPRCGCVTQGRGGTFLQNESGHRACAPTPTGPVDLGLPGEVPSLVARPQRLMFIPLGSERPAGRQESAPMLMNRAPLRETSDASRVSLVTGPCAERSVAVNSAYVSCRSCQLGHNALFSSQGGPHNVIAPHDQ